MSTMTREPLSSSAARDAILSRHDGLRCLVTETIHYADDAIKFEEDCEPLRTHAKELYAAFEEHINLEERFLATALRDVIGWGSVLQAQMEEEREKQRAILASALSALEPNRLSPDGLIKTVRAVADTLLDDLESEERCLLTADLDAIASDSQGG
jgi:hypothetical protein